MDPITAAGILRMGAVRSKAELAGPLTACAPEGGLDGIPHLLGYFLLCVRRSVKIICRNHLRPWRVTSSRQDFPCSARHLEIQTFQH